MFRALASVLVVGATSVTLTGCDQLNPASVCSDPNTLAEIKTLLAKQIGGDKATLDALDPHFNLLTLTSYDKTNRKITCSAQVNVTIPKTDQAYVQASQVGMAYMEENTPLKNLDLQSGEAEVKLTYSRQPTADGQNFVYSYESIGVIEELARVVSQFEAMKAQAKTQAPVAASPPIVESSKPPDAPNTTSADNSLTNTDP